MYMCMNCSVYVLQLQVLTPTAATLVNVKAVKYSHHIPLLGAVALITLKENILILETPVKCAANVKVHEISTLPIPPLQLAGNGFNRRNSNLSSITVYSR